MTATSSPIQLFNTIFYKRILFYQKCVGCDALTENFRPNFVTAFFCGMVVLFMLCNGYTLATYDTMTRLKCMAIFGLGIQGFSKFPTIILYSTDIYALVAFLRSIYQGNRQTMQPAYAVLRRWASIMSAVMRLGSMVIIVATLLFVPESWLESVRDGHRVPMLNTMVPGVRVGGDGNWPGYVAVYGFHAVLVFLGATGTCAVDMLLVMLVIHLCPMAEIFAQMLQDLRQTLRQTERESFLKSPKFRVYFRNILLVHREFTGYLRTIANVYFFVFFAEIYSDALSLCVLIVCYIHIDWIAIYPLWVLFVSKLFAYCFLGTIAQVATERIYAALLDCDWYLLPVQQKREFFLMVRAAQSPAVLKAGTMVLNLDAFVQVSRGLV